MECDICTRKDVAQVGMFCPSCARTSIYALRLEAVRILSERQKIGSRVEDAIKNDSTTAEARKLNKVWHAEVNKAASAEVREKIEEKKLEIASLRSRIADMRADIAESKSHVERKKGDLDAIKTHLPDRQHQRLGEITGISKRHTSSLDMVSARSIAFKLSLCTETARLLRLKRTREKVGDLARDQYWISGFAIPDLRTINGLQCNELTATLAVYSHMLLLVAFYLGVQLPAEITLPHRNYPLGTIDTPSTSYSSTRKIFPGSGSLSSGSSTTTSKQDKRPRPLFIGSDDEMETVSQFAKKDPTAFSFFVEGIALLAWNIAWLAQSQGLTAGTESWSDACKIGRNLYRLLFSYQKPPLIQRKSSNRNTRQQEVNHQGQSTDATQSGTPIHRSHASAHNFLTNHRSASTLPKYTVISDSLRKTLITEGKDAEWEVLGEDEVDDGAEKFDEAVVVRTRAMDGKDFDDARSIMTTRTHREDFQQANGLRSKGTSGWTKVKSRESAS